MRHWQRSRIHVLFRHPGLIFRFYWPDRRCQGDFPVACTAAESSDAISDTLRNRPVNWNTLYRQMKNFHMS